MISVSGFAHLALGMMLFGVARNYGSPTASAPISIDRVQSSVLTSPPFSAETASAPDEILVGETTFSHSGFRTQVTESFSFEAALSDGTVTTITLSLQNLSRPSGSLQTRATINFNRTIDSYLELPTIDGPLRLYLHRDGTLRTEADPGGFT